MPAPLRAGLRKAPAEFLRLQIAGPAVPGSLPMRPESQFLSVAPPRAPARDLPHSRWRSEARMLPLPAASAGQAERSKQLLPVAGNSRWCASAGQSCASWERGFRHNAPRETAARPALVPRILRVSAGPAGNSCANRALPALPGPTATLSKPVKGPVLPAEIEILWALRR